VNDLTPIYPEGSGRTAVPVVDVMPADLFTPLAVYLKLARQGSSAFLLESVEGGESLARYSFIGVDPYQTLSGNGNAACLRRRDSIETIEKPLWTVFREQLRSLKTNLPPGLPSFIGGAIGYLGFECTGWFEPSLRGDFSLPIEAEFMFFRSVIAFDHAKQTVLLISLANEEPADGILSIREAKLRNAAIRTQIESGLLELPGFVPPEPGSEVVSNWEKDEFIAAVSGIKESIAAGDCYQVVLSQCFSKRTNASPVSIYRAIRSLNPSPYMFLLQFADKAVIGASPEMLVRVRGRKLEYRPIAGTRPRGQTPEEDERLACEMKNDEKEVAEHRMLVDLGRNDLGRVAKFGSVKVAELMAVERYSHVQHLVSRLTAELRDGFDGFDALASCFPAGTVSGAPKVSAIEKILELEPSPRGIYAGAVGYFDHSGNVDTCIAIRTVELAAGVAKVQAGAGIVADSDPASEFEETVNKAKVMLKAIEIAEGEAQ
jgi:anthranilate synthase component I